ncbi:ATP synthase F1 subunit delta [bacterium]|nr:ATP synthase F1 subunit delta [bacterium]
MANQAAAANELGTRYGRALFELAENRNQTAKVAEALSALAEVYAENADFRRVISAPVVTQSDKLGLIQAIAKKYAFPATLTDTLQLMAEKDRLSLIPQLNDAFLRQMREASGVVAASVTTAYELSDAERKALTGELEKAVGSKVELHEEVNENILGGVVVRLGSQMMDLSLRSQLTSLKRQLRKAALGQAA